MTPIQIAENSKNMSSLRKARSAQDILSILSSIRGATKAHAITVESIYLAATRLKQNRIESAGLEHKHTLTGRSLSKYKSLVARIAKHHTVLNALAVHKIEIGAIEAHLLQNTQVRKQESTLTLVMDLNGYVYKNYLRCLRSISVLASKYQPRQLITLRSAVETHIEDSLPSSRYSRLSSNVFVSATSENNIEKFVFQQYINIRGLIDDDKYVVDDFYIILSCVLDNNGDATYHATSYKEFKSPGSFPLGAELTSIDEANEKVSKLLDDSSVKVKADMAPMKDINILGVKRVAVEPKKITLELKSGTTPKQINTILTETLPAFYALQGAHGMHKRQLLHRLRSDSAGRTKIEFILDKSESRTEVVDTKLGELRELFQLSDNDFKLVSRALTGA
jgi:hypothetical protein